MKQKNQYTDAEKIAKFDVMHDRARAEFNESAVDEDRDEHYFWEQVMVDVMDIDSNDWDMHNNGHQF
jgi:hypothetical protein